MEVIDFPVQRLHQEEDHEDELYSGGLPTYIHGKESGRSEDYAEGISLLTSQEISDRERKIGGEVEKHSPNSNYAEDTVSSTAGETSSDIRFSTVYVLAIVGMYIALNYYLNFTNKILFSVYNFQFPLMIIIGGTLATAVGSGLYLLVQSSGSSGSSSRITSGRLRRIWIYIIVLGVVHAFATGFENLALEYISLSMTQMLKATASIWTQILVYFHKGIHEGRPRIIASIVQVIGAALSVYKNPELNFLGILFVFISLAAGIFQLYIAERLMADTHLTPMELTFCISFPAVLTLLPMIEVEELQHMKELFAEPLIVKGLFMSTTVVALVYNVVQFQALQATNAVFMNVVGNFKTALLVVLSIQVFHESLSWINYLGIAVALVSSFVFTYLKYKKASSQQEVPKQQ